MTRARALTVALALALTAGAIALAGGCNPDQLPPSWKCGWGSFNVGNWPTSCWRPFNDQSPFNTTFDQLANEGRLVPLPNSQQIVNRLLGWGGFVPMNNGGWQHPIYWSRPTDPEFVIHCTEQWGTCEVEGERVRIPAEARPAAETDRHLTVIDQRSGWEYDFWLVENPGPVGNAGGQLRIAWGGKTRIDGDGLDSNATAAHFGGAAGVVRAAELQAGRIEHALFAVVKCTNGTSVWPANRGTGAVCPNSADRAAAPPMGALLRLDMTESQIDALPVPAWKKPILKALAKYGALIGDTGGPSVWLQFEAPETYTSFGYPDPFAEFARRNQGQGGISSHNGLWYFDIKSGVDWQHHLRVYTVRPPG